MAWSIGDAKSGTLALALSAISAASAATLTYFLMRGSKSSPAAATFAPTGELGREAVLSALTALTAAVRELTIVTGSFNELRIFVLIIYPYAIAHREGEHTNTLREQREREVRITSRSRNCTQPLSRVLI